MFPTLNMKTIIAKITYDCNLNCKYCSVGSQERKGFMSKETLVNIHRKVSKWGCADTTTIIWNGGEPLLAGIKFFKKIKRIQKSMPSHKFINLIQSNGTLLNKEYYNFLESEGFRIGLSLDGIRATHDFSRPYKNGKSSFQDTLYWVKKQRGAICVLNENTCQHLDLIYELAKENKIRFQFNLQYQVGNALTCPELALHNEKIASAYIKLFDLWFNDKENDRADIEYFDNLVRNINIINIDSDEIINVHKCVYKNDCQHNLLGIGPSGDLYPCCSFASISGFIYGNINHRGELTDMLNNPVREKFLKRHDGLDECKSCKYLKICNSGCPLTTYVAFGDIMRKHPYCTSYLELYNHVEMKLGFR